MEKQLYKTLKAFFVVISITVEMQLRIRLRQVKAVLKIQFSKARKVRKNIKFFLFYIKLKNIRSIFINTLWDGRNLSLGIW